ncbi:hypothetical protein L7F22_009233 [Adiantum nelumboides]|nr:hypothetical protein [Adiantum nelumboides]
MSSRLTDLSQWDPQYQHSQHYTYANSFKMSYYHQPRHAPSLNIAAAAAEATQGSDLPVGSLTNNPSGQYHSVPPQAQVNGSYNLPFSNNSMQYISGSPLYSNSSNNHPLSAGASSHGSFHNGRHNDFNNGSNMPLSASSMQTSYDFHHQGSLQSSSNHSDLMSSHPFDNPGMFPVKAKRKQVKNACVNCQKACKRCDEGRPCSRCIKYGLTATCMDSARKERKRGIKRGPYKRRATTGSQPTGTTNWGNNSYMHSSSSSLMLGHGNGYNNSSSHHHGMALHSAPLYSNTQGMRSNLNEGQTSFNDVSRSPIEHLPHGSNDSLINNTSAPSTVQRSTVPLTSLSYDTASSTSPSMYGRDHNSSNNFLNANSSHHRLHTSESGLAILSNGSTATTSSILSPRTPIGSSEAGNNVVGEYHLTSSNTSPGGQQKMNGTTNTTISSLTNLTTGAFLNPMNQSGNSTFPLHLPQAARLRGMNNGSTSLPFNTFSNEKGSIINIDSRPRYNNSYSHDEPYTPVNANHNNNEVENFELDRASQYLPRKRFVASSPIVRPLL